MATSQIDKLFDKDPFTGNTIFHELAYIGSLTLLKRFRNNLDEPCTFILQQFNSDGEYSIHVAANVHRDLHAIQVIELLRDLGADLDARDDQLGITVLHIAVHYSDYVLAQWLCAQSQIDINAEDVDGDTAYQLALQNQDQQMMDILRTYGARCSSEQQE